MPYLHHQLSKQLVLTFISLRYLPSENGLDQKLAIPYLQPVEMVGDCSDNISLLALGIGRA